MEIEDVELNVHEMAAVEDAVIALSKGLKITEAEVIQLIEDGGVLNPNTIKSHRFKYMIDELRATFDAY